MRLEREENVSEQKIPSERPTNGGAEEKIESEQRKRSKNENGDECRYETMRQIVESGRQEEAFFLCDQDKLVRNYKYWTEKLQNVTPYFDAGCNTSNMVLSTLAELGAKFSCQNKLEMEQLSKIGIPASDIVFGSSIKVASHLRFAETFGVRVMAFESLAEIAKIKKNSPDARLVYRLNFPLSNNQTFSIPIMSELFAGAKSAGLDVIGVSLNLAETSLIQYQKAVSLARLIFALGQSLGHDLQLLDLGEIMPNTQNLQEFEELVVSVRSWVTGQFQSLENFNSLQIFAHPSNFLVDSAFCLATKVIGKRVSRSNGNTSYVINDGIFGAFGRLLHEDDLLMEPKSLYENANCQVATCDVYGPSGHDMDQICFGHRMTNLEIGDWLIFDNMGAFAMSQWENNYSVHDGSGFLSQSGALLVADNFWFYSKGASIHSTTLELPEQEKPCNASDDEEILSAFYQLPDMNQNDEEKYFTLLR